MKWFLACCLLALSVSSVGAQIVINEMVYDDCTADDEEFVELYNAGAAPVDLSGWMLECLDGAWPNDDNPDYIIPAGVILGPGDYYVMGSPLVPNVDLVIGSVAIFENDNESLVLRDASGAIRDIVGYESNKNSASYPFQFVDGDGLWGAAFSLTSTRQSWSRWQDGFDTDDNGADFGLLPRSPGTTNDISAPTAYTENFDGLATESIPPRWRGTFLWPRVIVPGVITANNPHPIPASPQGGKAMILAVPSGGGNSTLSEGAPAFDFKFEAWVYFRADLVCPEFETWSIGVRGTAETFHFHPNADPAHPPCGNASLNQVNPQANGNTGIAWEYTGEGGFGTLRLVDENNGGGDQTVIGSILIFPGINDGWQRLRLEAVGNVVVGTFGGTYGSVVDGRRFAALTSTVQRGTVYFGYREVIAADPARRPLTMDAIDIQIGAEPFSVFFTQPNGPASIAFDMRGMTPGLETFTAISLEGCPGGAGTGPYLGLCASDPMVLVEQTLLPLGFAPFHFMAPSNRLVIGPFLASFLPPQQRLEAVSAQVSGGAFVAVSAATGITLP